MSRPNRLRCAALLVVAVLAGGSVAGAGESLSGVVVEVLEVIDGSSSLRVQVGERGDSPISEVLLDLGKRGAPETVVGLLPPGWQQTLDRGTWRLFGQPVETPVYVRLDPTSRIAIPKTVGVAAISGGALVFKERVPVAYRAMPEGDFDDLDRVIILPPSIAPGEIIGATVVDPARAPADGRWSLGDSDGQSKDPQLAGRSGYHVQFPVPADLEPGSPVELVYVDPWGETTIAADAGADLRVGALDEETSAPRIDSSQRYVFLDQTACICGNFPTVESRSGLIIDGLPVGEPVAASSSVVVIRLPEGTGPGAHAVTGDPGRGFAREIETELVALRLSGSIDQEVLLRGQSTPMHIVIEGAEEPLDLVLTNHTPEIIVLEGGDEGLVTTSGGADNKVERQVRGVQPGDFNLSYRMANDPCPCGPEEEEGGTPSMGSDGPDLQTGYPLPAGVTVESARGTGRTTGHIATLEIRNDGSEAVVFPDRLMLIPSTGKYQGYVVPDGGGTTVEPGSTATVPLDGYCTDVRKPAVPSGESMPGVDEWIVPIDHSRPLPRPTDPGFQTGSEEARILGGFEAIERATEELQSSGELKTPFSSDPEREREAVIQQTLWRYTAELAGDPYTREEFAERLETQYEERTGTDFSSAPAEDRERLERGVEDFWSAFELVGSAAKIPISDETTPTTTPESVPVATEKPPCEIDRSMEHSEADSEFKMSESYKDEDKRANLREWFADLPDISSAPEGGTFEATRYPASSWAVAGRDFIGGYTNAVAKHVYMEAGGGTDWVWSTELITVDADSNGTHTMTVEPPPGGECETLVVGAGGGVVEAWSNTIDPIANTRDIVEALRIVRDLTVIVVSVALAPATAGASLAVGVGTMIATKAFDGEFSSDANAAVAVEGRMQVQAGRRRVQLDANSRSTLSNDGDVESDAAKAAVGETSDSHPTTLSVTTSGLSALKSRAESNGIAEGNVESQIGVAIVAFCRCGDAVQVEYLTDSGLFLVEQGAAAAAIRTAARLEEMLGETIDPYLELPPDQVIPKASRDLPTDLEKMLRDWYMENGSGEGGTGYFGIKP